MTDTRRCPDCGGKLRIRTSKALVKLREAFRECTRCRYRDVATIRPAEILAVRVVGTTADAPPRTLTAVK